MQKTIKKHGLAILFLAIVSLLPWWWLRDGSIIAGHDAGLPLSPSEHFLDRMSVWTYRYQGGSDQTFALAGFFLHGLEFLTDQLPLSLSHQQSLQFSLYFFLFGVSMYFASNLLFPNQNPWYHTLAGTIYQFNHFILQAWFIAERTKFTIYIALPIVIALIIKTAKGEINPIKSGTVIALTVWVFNGGGFLPLYGSLFITSLTVATGMIIGSKEKKQSAYLLGKTGLIATTCLAGLNAFWLAPYIRYLQQSYTQVVSQAGGLAGIINWIKSISEATSFTNIFRLQGIQEWYVNPEHPYASPYLSEPFLIVASFIPITLLTIALHRARRQKNIAIIVLMGMALTSVFLMAGSHPPFGHIYLLMVKLIPGFIAFRTPYYKFAPGLLSALALIAPWVIAQINRRRVAIPILAILCVIGYNYPFFTTNFFHYTSDRSTKVQIPSYVYDYAKFIKNDGDTIHKTLLYPGLDTQDFSSKYTWGYWSLAPLHSLLDTHQYVTPLSGNGLKQTMINSLYDDIAQGKPFWIDAARMLGIDSILVEKDFVEFRHLGNSSADIASSLEADSRLTLIEEFGQWSLYKLDEPNKVQEDAIVVTNPLSFNTLYDFLFSNTTYDWNFVVTNSKIAELNTLGYITQANCQDCELKREQLYVANPNIIFTPTSPFFDLEQQFDNESNSPVPPISSLKKLYLIQTMINRKEPGKSRLSTWDAYIEVLKAYEEQVANDITQLPSTNRDLSFKLANIQFQRDILKNISVFMNSKEESDEFIEAVLLTNAIQSTIVNNINITTDANEYMYSLDIQESGDYQSYVLAEDLNAPYYNKNVSITLDDSLSDIATASDSSWLSIGSYSLESGIHKIKLIDQPYQSNQTDIPSKVMIGGINSCEVIYSESLPKGQFTFQFDTETTKDDLSLWTHVSDESTERPLLPYWGFETKAEQNLKKTQKIIHELKYPSRVDVYVCAHTYAQSTEVLISNFNVIRQTSPSLVFFKPHTSPTSRGARANIRRVSNVKTIYEFDTSGPSILNTARPSDNGWQIVSHRDLEYRVINDENAGIVLNPNTESSVTEEFAPQRLYNIGWLVSGIFLTLTLFGAWRRYE